MARLVLGVLIGRWRLVVNSLSKVVSKWYGWWVIKHFDGLVLSMLAGSIVRMGSLLMIKMSRDVMRSKSWCAINQSVHLL